MATRGYPLFYSPMPLFSSTRPPPSQMIQSFQPYGPYPMLLHKSAANLVQVINNTEKGKRPLKEIFNIFAAKEENDKIHIQKLLNETDKNFEIERISTNSQEPDEWVTVFTKLTLCSYHCKTGIGGRNKKCHGQCGALHICRTFLLKSSEECYFNKKGQCMFGHDFRSEHNSRLLKEHNLETLSDAELRQLFRRPNSRCQTTIPQVCRFYNSDKQIKCTKKNCTSLHICLKFILDRANHDKCSKNHSFDNEQVKKCLDLFEIKSPWKAEEIFDQLHQFTKTGKPSDSDGLPSETSDAGSNHSRRSSLSVTSDIFYPYLGPERSQDNCNGCTKLMEEFNLLKQEVAALKSEVEKLKAKQEPQATHARICPISGLPFTE